MSITAETLREEHEAAMAALTSTQRRAIERLAKARRMSTFNHRWPDENLARLFEAEAIEAELKEARTEAA